MNEQQLKQAFIQFLAQKTGARNQLELEAAILLMGEEGLQLAYAEFMQAMQQQQVLAAKFGARLNYIRKLRGQCPEGYEMQYYKAGGQLCKKCMKKLAMEEGGEIPLNPIDLFKCGRKMKKKKAQGGAIDLDKCGGKTKKPKKKENGGELVNSTRNPLSFSKMALAKCGAKLKEAAEKVDMDKCGKKMKKKQSGGTVKKYPLKDDKGKTKYYSDRATRDSIAANRYNDEDVMGRMPGNFKKDKKGQTRWTPDRTKSPYKKK